MKAPFMLIATVLTIGHAFAQDEPFRLSHAIELESRSAGQQAGVLSGMQEKLMFHYYEAVIADLEYQAAAENVAMDYVTFSRLQKTTDGTSADAEIAAKVAEIKYRSSLERRLMAAKQQRLAREALKALTHLDTPPSVLEPLPTSHIPGQLPPAEDLVPVMLKHNAQWRQADTSRTPASKRVQLKASMQAQLLENRLEFDRLAKGSLPRVTAEVDHADLLLEKAREDLAAGRRSDIGYAMARTSDIKAKQARVLADLALVMWRLESLLGIPLREISTN